MICHAIAMFDCLFPQATLVAVRAFASSRQTWLVALLAGSMVLRGSSLPSLGAPSAITFSVVFFARGVVGRRLRWIGGIMTYSREPWSGAVGRAVAVAPRSFAILLDHTTSNGAPAAMRCRLAAPPSRRTQRQRQEQYGRQRQRGLGVGRQGRRRGLRHLDGGGLQPIHVKAWLAARRRRDEQTSA